MIAFLSDFGHVDPYVGIVKGVIHSIVNDTHVIDLTHEIEPGNIFQASFVLGISYSYFPKGTIFLCVVDPGVGSDRRGIVGAGGGYFFVGPDNGIFSHVSNELDLKFVEIKNKDLFLSEVSVTFHGRDVFGPVAAHLEKGVRLEDIGPGVEDITILNIPKPIKKGNSIQGEILYFDRFGNAITNIPLDLFDGSCKQDVKCLSISVKGHKFPVVDCYESGKGRGVFGILGSHGFLELSIYLGSVRSRLGVNRGDKVEIFCRPLDMD